MKAAKAIFLIACGFVITVTVRGFYRTNHRHEPPEIVSPLNSSVISPEKLNRLIEVAAKESLCPQVTPQLLRGVIEVESGWDPRATRFEKHYFDESGTRDDLPARIEAASSHGLTQIMTPTAAQYGVSVDELYDVETSIRLGALLLGKDICVHEKFNTFLGLVAYNAGPKWRTKSAKVQEQAKAHARKVLRAVGLDVVVVGTTPTLTAKANPISKEIRRGV